MGGNAFGCVGWAILIFAYWLLVKDRTPINDRQYRPRLNAMSQNAKKQAAIAPPQHGNAPIPPCENRKMITQAPFSCLFSTSDYQHDIGRDGNSPNHRQPAGVTIDQPSLGDSLVTAATHH